MLEPIKLIALPIFAVIEVMATKGYSGGTLSVIAWAYFMNWLEGYPVWNSK